MRKVRTRGSTRLRHEPYPLNEFPASVIQGIAKRKSGLAGAKVRAQKLTAEERTAIAHKAASARWK